MSFKHPPNGCEINRNIKLKYFGHTQQTVDRVSVVYRQKPLQGCVMDHSCVSFQSQHHVLSVSVGIKE